MSSCVENENIACEALVIYTMNKLMSLRALEVYATKKNMLGVVIDDVKPDHRFLEL